MILISRLTLAGIGVLGAISPGLIPVVILQNRSYVCAEVMTTTKQINFTTREGYVQR